jgi:hypothetical protein
MDGARRSVETAMTNEIRCRSTGSSRQPASQVLLYNLNAFLVPASPPLPSIRCRSDSLHGSSVRVILVLGIGVLAGNASNRVLTRFVAFHDGTYNLQRRGDGHTRNQSGDIRDKRL